jgi:hypothetical protein
MQIPAPGSKTTDSHERPTPAAAAVPVSPALVKAAEAAWSRYSSACRLGATAEKRARAYLAASAAERRVWQAEGSAAAKV